MSDVINDNGELTGPATAQIVNAFYKLDLISRPTELGTPYCMTTGKGRVSTVCFYFIPVTKGSSSGKYFVVKFDAPQRAQEEWRSWAKLKKISLPPTIPRPLNNSSDGLMIFESTVSWVHDSDIIDMEKYLIDYLMKSKDGCTKAIELLFEKVLSSFYSDNPGKSTATPGGISTKWIDVFKKFRDPVVIASIKKILEIPKINMIERRELEHPITDFEERVKQPTGNMWASLVHGDLNLSNIMFGIKKGSDTPDDVFVIDMASASTDSFAITDIVRLESEFWHEVYTKVAAKNKWDEAKILKKFILIRDILDGRKKFGFFIMDALIKKCFRVVCVLRERAAKSVRLNYDSPDFIEKYHTALYFTHLRALAFPTINDPEKGGSALKTYCAFLGASLSLNVLKGKGLKPPKVKDLRTPKIEELRPPKSGLLKRFYEFIVTLIIAIIVAIITPTIYQYIHQSKAPEIRRPEATYDVYIRTNNTHPVDVEIDGKKYETLTKEQFYTTIKLSEGTHTLKAVKYTTTFKIDKDNPTLPIVIP